MSRKQSSRSGSLTDPFPWHFTFLGDEAEWKEWVAHWKKTVPRCPRFECIHELMSCGTDRLCPITCFTHASECGGSSICNDVNCMDCSHYSSCIRGRSLMRDRKLSERNRA